MKLSECVRAWLDHTGRRQTDIAARAKLPLPMLNGIAKGRNANPRWSTVVKIAHGFGVEVAEFLAGPPTDLSSHPPAQNLRLFAHFQETQMTPRILAFLPREPLTCNRRSTRSMTWPGNSSLSPDDMRLIDLFRQLRRVNPGIEAVLRRLAVDYVGEPTDD